MKCYFLIFRTPICGCFDLDEPTAGLVVEAGREIDGIPVADIDLVRAVAEQRIHCGPHERLVLAEVFEDADRFKAKVLHRHWEMEMHSFLELMEA